jgi:hypothetical protein
MRRYWTILALVGAGGAGCAGCAPYASPAAATGPLAAAAALTCADTLASRLGYRVVRRKAAIELVAERERDQPAGSDPQALRWVDRLTVRVSETGGGSRLEVVPAGYLEERTFRGPTEREDRPTAATRQDAERIAGECTRP